MRNVGEDAVHLQVHACVFLVNLIICHNNEIRILKRACFSKSADVNVGSVEIIVTVWLCHINSVYKLFFVKLLLPLNSVFSF